MKKPTPSYQRHRFPSEIISHAIWLYHRFCLSFREVEELLAERGITVTYETVRQWCRKFGPAYARKLKKRQGRLGDTWHLDEVFVSIQGEQQYLWRAVDQDGDTLDISVQRLNSSSKCNSFSNKWNEVIVKELVGGSIPAGFSRTIIEEVDGLVHLLPGDLPEIRLLGKELS